MFHSLAAGIGVWKSGEAAQVKKFDLGAPDAAAASGQQFDLVHIEFQVKLFDLGSNVFGEGQILEFRLKVLVPGCIGRHRPNSLRYIEVKARDLNA